MFMSYTLERRALSLSDRWVTLIMIQEDEAVIYSVKGVDCSTCPVKQDEVLSYGEEQVE